MATPAVAPAPVLNGFEKYFSLALGAFQMADQLGAGQPGQTKAQIAMKLVNTGLAVTAGIVPAAAPVISLGEELEPAFQSLFTGIFHLIKHTKAAAPAPAPVAN